MFTEMANFLLKLTKYIEETVKNNYQTEAIIKKQRKTLEEKSFF